MHGTMESFASSQTDPRVVLAHGCFDILHLGHIRHLEEAKRLGDKLVVSITADEFVRKGIGRPHFTATQRAEALKALTCVDDVVINDAPGAVDLIKTLKPDIYVKGIDYSVADEGLELERAAVESHGGRLHITQTEKWSSTQILNSERFSQSTLAYLAHARDHGFRDAIHAAFERADAFKIAFVGETILDEYRYVGSLSKPLKEFVLATVEVREPDCFLGGAHAAHLHGEWKHTVLVTDDGEPLRKTRYVDADFTRKLFECYSKRRLELTEEARWRFCNKLIAAVRDCDVVVVLDFGHGLIGSSERYMVQGARFLALNAQSNAGNYGFNPVINYNAVDYVCVDEPEARLATGMQVGEIDDVMSRLRNYMSSKTRLIVTQGRYGCTVQHAEGNGMVPPFAAGGIDTMGAGDAFLAVTAPLVAAGLVLEAAAFVGNIVGAIKVGILGHQRHVTRSEILQTVDALLA